MLKSSFIKYSSIRIHACETQGDGCKMLGRGNAIIDSNYVDHGFTAPGGQEEPITSPKKPSTQFNKLDFLDYSPAEIAVDTITLPWEMSRVERMAFQHLLGNLQPAIALEVGTGEGGSLQAIMQYADEAISIDVNVATQTSLQKMPCFNGVEFIAGESAKVLPEVVHLINKNQLNVNFVYLDGDQSTAGAQSDFEAALKIIPKQPTCIVMHNSFMPQVRRAMINVNWQENAHVHYVDIDYVQGAYVPMEYGACKLIGGLAVALLKPEPRTEALDVYRSYDHAFNMLLPFAANK